MPETIYNAIDVCYRHTDSTVIQINGSIITEFARMAPDKKMLLPPNNGELIIRKKHAPVLAEKGRLRFGLC